MTTISTVFLAGSLYSIILFILQWITVFLINNFSILQFLIYLFLTFYFINKCIAPPPLFKILGIIEIYSYFFPSTEIDNIDKRKYLHLSSVIWLLLSLYWLLFFLNSNCCCFSLPYLRPLHKENRLFLFVNPLEIYL